MCVFIYTSGIIFACYGSFVPKPWNHCCRWGLPVWLWSLNMCLANLGKSWVQSTEKKKLPPLAAGPDTYTHSWLCLNTVPKILLASVCPHVLQDHAQWNLHKPSIVGKAPREGRGIVVQDQQNPSTHLDSTVERGLARIVADLCFQLVLVVGIGTDPIGRLLRQLSQGGMTLQARHEIADRLQPSMGDEPQVETSRVRWWKSLHKIPSLLEMSRV